ncbi:MAG: hypothetical protein ABL879_16745 [Devosia sp.]
MPGQLLAVMHVADVHRGHVNLRTRRNPLDVYLECAVTCAKSFARQGWTLRVVSDDPGRLEQRARELGFGPDELPPFEHFQFTLDVPEGIRFRGSHFRLGLIKALAEGHFGPEVGMIDVDTVALNPLVIPELAVDELIGYASPDDGYHTARQPRISDEIEVLGGTRVENPQWYGGEFIYGRAEAFARIVEPFEKVWSIYKRDVKRFHHVGDETVWNAIFQGYDAVRIVDAGQINLLNRWWGRSMPVRQLSFATVATGAIAHLAGDKTFIAAQARKPFDRETFIRAYQRRLRLVILGGGVGNAWARLNGRRGQYQPRYW